MGFREKWQRPVRQPSRIRTIRLVGLIVVNQLLQIGRHSCQFVGRNLRVAGPFGGTLSRLGDLRDVLGNFGAAGSRLRHRAIDLGRGRRLLFDRTGDRVLQLADLVDHGAYLTDGFDRLLRYPLE